MENQEIVKTFISKGFQLGPDTLNYFSNNPDKIPIFLTKATLLQQRPKIVTKSVVENILGKQLANVRIMRKFEERKTPLTIEDAIQYFYDRYEKLRKILSLRIDLVNLISINKISPSMKKFSLIGMVKEKDAELKTAELEDTSGTAIINFPQEMKDEYKMIVEDEVIGAVCTFKDNEIVVERIFWPDIPLTRQIKRSEEEIECLILSGLDFKSEKFNKHSYEKFLSFLEKKSTKKVALIVLGQDLGNSDYMKGFLEKVPSNCMVFAETQLDEDTFKIELPTILEIGGVKIFVDHGEFLEKYQEIFNTSPEMTVVNLLKKRHINPTFKFNRKIYKDDPYMIDEIPDIVAFSHFKKPGIANYKGTTVICNGSFSTEPVYWIINLRTRETIKIDFT